MGDQNFLQIDISFESKRVTENHLEKVSRNWSKIVKCALILREYLPSTIFILFQFLKEVTKRGEGGGGPLFSKYTRKFKNGKNFLIKIFYWLDFFSACFYLLNCTCKFLYGIIFYSLLFTGINMAIKPGFIIFFFY